MKLCILSPLLSIGLALNAQTELIKPNVQVVNESMILHDPTFSQCHASTLTELGNGDLLAAFFAGTHEGASDVKIWAVQYSGNRWSRPVVVADGIMEDSLRYACWNPVLFRHSNGIIYLFYKVGKNPREWFGMMKTSVDEGKSWSSAKRLPAGCLGPVRNKPAELTGGILLCPSSTETESEWKVQMELFDPASNAWTIIPVDPGSPFQVIQPTFLFQPDRTIRMLCRSKGNAVVTAVSDPLGTNWSALSTIALPNPNSAIDGVTLTDGSHLLVYNPLVSGKEWYNGRHCLNLSWSADGINWTDILVLEKEESGEFSYPAIIQTRDGLIHITYTHNRNQIRYWKIQLIRAL